MTELAKVPSSAPLDVSGARTDHELIGAWLAGAPETTARAYRSDLAWWRERLPAGVPLRELTTTAIVAALEQHSGAEATRARRVASLRSLVRFGCRVGYLRANPVAALRARRGGADLAARIMEPADVAALLAACETSRHPLRDRALVRLAYSSGARVAELCAVSWSDIRERADGSGALRLRGKGGKRRSVWLPERAMVELGQLAASGPSSGAVLRARTGKRLGARDAHRIIRRLAARAGLGAVSPHWLRHACATHALEGGAPVHQVQADLGHASLATTSRYVHARPSTGSARWLPL